MSAETTLDDVPLPEYDTRHVAVIWADGAEHPDITYDCSVFEAWGMLKAAVWRLQSDLIVTVDGEMEEDDD